MKIDIKIPLKSCETCLNVMQGHYGLFCHEFLEDIINADIANECSCYEKY